MSESIHKRHVSVDEAANELGIRPSTIRRRILERRIGYLKIGRSVLIPLTEIERLIKEGYRPPLNRKE